MKKSLYGKKRIVVLVVVVLLVLFACTPVGFDSFIEIQNQEKQYAAMEQELKDLKTIQVNCLAPERYAEMKDKIYENYFCNKDDKEHQEEETEETVYGGKAHTITYDNGEIYQTMAWWDNGVSYIGELFGEDCIYETTEEQVIQEETEKLFQLLGLKLGDRENGYMIDRMEVQQDNSIEVWIKRYIEGKQLSLAAPPCSEDISKDLDSLEDIVLEFGNNRIIDMRFAWMIENPKIEDYEEEILVNGPEKAYKLLTNYIGSSVGTEKLSIDAVRIAYQPVRKKDNLYILYPQVEFYTDPSTENGAIWKIYQMNLTTKEIRG